MPKNWRHFQIDTIWQPHVQLGFQVSLFNFDQPEVRFGSFSWLWRLSGVQSSWASAEESLDPLLSPQECPRPWSGLKAPGGFNGSLADANVVLGPTETALVIPSNSSCFKSELSVRGGLIPDWSSDSWGPSSGSGVDGGLIDERVIWEENETSGAVAVSLLDNSILSLFLKLGVFTLSSFCFSSFRLSLPHEQFPGVPGLTAWLQSSFSPTSSGWRTGTSHVQEPVRRRDPLSPCSSSDTSSGSPQPWFESSATPSPWASTSSVVFPVVSIGTVILTSGTEVGKVHRVSSVTLEGDWQMSLVVSHGEHLGPPGPPAAPLW